MLDRETFIERINKFQAGTFKDLLLAITFTANRIPGPSDVVLSVSDDIDGLRVIGTYKIPRITRHRMRVNVQYVDQAFTISKFSEEELICYMVSILN